MTQPPGLSAEAQLQGLSLAEWEYAWRYADHLSVGEREPDAAGFDPERVGVIRRTLQAAWGSYTSAIRRRR